MSYTVITEKSTDDTWTARENNELRNNFEAGIGLVSSKGDLLIASAEDTAVKLSIGSDDEMLVSNSSEQGGREWVGSGLVPIGGIVIWSGSEGSIPTGWQICDGSNGTPNLQDRFVVGSGDDYTTDDTGGQTTVDLEHDHDYAAETSEDGSHSHTIAALSGGTHSHTVGVTNEIASGDLAPVQTGTDLISEHTHTFSGSGSTDTDGSHTHPGRSVSDGEHTHTMNDSQTDNQLSSSQDIRPPYYALCYIQRLT